MSKEDHKGLLFIPIALNVNHVTFYTCCVLGGPCVLYHYFIPRMIVEPIWVGNEQYAFGAGRVRKEQ